MNRKLQVKLPRQQIFQLHLNRSHFFYSQVSDWGMSGAKPKGFGEFWGRTKKERL